MGNAILSPCGRYRYLLQRGEGRLLPFVMLNPSTADAEQDDPTIRRCMGFAAREGYDGIEVGNVYAWRATDPRELRSSSNPFGDNVNVLIGLSARAASNDTPIVCAWGTNVIGDHAARTIELLRHAGARLVCLGKTKAGHPKHPLYLAANTPLEAYP